MIVGTAGHIDHGKTTLVHALTGTQTDRLKEEKLRGISIELGYAYASLDNGDVLGFIDVPGHERLVHTMAAGASGIDFGLLVIAADDGLMPQTHEHLAILTLLGLQQGAVAITKIDRVDEIRLAQVQHDIAQLVEGTFLQDAAVFPLSATDADLTGVDALRQHLHETAQLVLARPTKGLFRLAIDRVFTLPGHGTVVTGTAHAGAINLHDKNNLRLMPADLPVRIRSIHAQNQSSDTGWAGQRCALNLAGIDKNQVNRGDWIADARCFLPSHNVDVELSLLTWADASVRAWSPLHIHIGAAHYLAHVVPLTSDSLAAGQSGLAQLVFDQPVCVMPGDRYIARNAQARLTVGGGVVLDPNAPARKRRSVQRLAWLDAVANWLMGSGASALLAQVPHGLEEDALVRLTGTPAASVMVPDDALWIPSTSTKTQPVLILRRYWSALQDKAVNTLSGFHAAAPDEPGLDSARWRRMAIPTLTTSLWLTLIDCLTQQKRVVCNGPWWSLPGHVIPQSPEDLDVIKQVMILLHAGEFDPPWPRDLAIMVKQPEERVRHLLRKQLRCGQVFQVVRDLFYHTDQVQRLAALLQQLSLTDGVSAAQFRDATGLGRKRAIQLLEFFGRIGYTRRLGDKHILRDNNALFTKDVQ